MGNNNLLERAIADLMADMKERGIGAIIWDNSTAGFHFIPEVDLAGEDSAEPDVRRVTGLYAYGDRLYIIEEDASGVSVDSYYNPDTEVKPSVVTLSIDRAIRELGDPADKPGYTLDGTLEEWLAIADCYYEALNLKE